MPIPKKPQKVRLDQLLVARGHFETVEEARAHILAGEIWSAQTRLDKAGALLAADLPIQVHDSSLKFVSRAGYKLEHALELFRISVQDAICLDIGSSTGGFTDCLLQRGAKHVFAVDSGSTQLHMRLRQDKRVTVMENFNARTLNSSTLQERNPAYSSDFVQFVGADVSFISLEKLIPSMRLAAPQAKDWVLLFKPQFEVERSQLLPGGIVRTPAATQSALARFFDFMTAQKFSLLNNPVESPLAGKKSGNVEILLHFGVQR